MASKPEQHGNRWRIIWWRNSARQTFYAETPEDALLAKAYVEALAKLGTVIGQDDPALATGAYRNSSLVNVERERQAKAVQTSTTFGALALADIDKRLAKSTGAICARTGDQYRWYLSTYLSEWTPLQVTNITPGVIRAMVTKLEGPEAAISSTPERPKGLGKGTRYGIMSFALAVLKAAFDDHVIATDVGATFRDENQDTRRGARKLRRVRAIERSEFDAMIAHAPMPMARDMAEALAFTGVRISELLALRVGDVLLGRTPDIKVERQWRRVNGGPAKLVGAKAGSDRRVRIDPKLVVTLAPYVEGRAADEWLFTEYDGKPWSYAQFMSRCWNPMINAARRAGAFYDARPVTPHDMRHSHASWLLSGGVPMEVVSERLGHRSIDMTIETYREFQKKDHDAVVAALRG